MKKLNSILLNACKNKNNNINTIIKLVKNGADVHAKDNENYTPLHLACENKQPKKVIEYLVTKGANVNAKNNYNETPLILALKSYNDFNDSSHLACENNTIEVIKYLVEHGADINSKSITNVTPLHIACINNTIEVIKYLVEHGADINAKNNDNFTPLHVVICENNNNTLEIIKFLIEQGADSNIKTNTNDTLLHMACEHNTIEVLEYLVNNVVGYEPCLDFQSKTQPHVASNTLNINDKNINNDTPLHIACSHNIKKVIKCLVDHGADINAKNNNDVTPLHSACFNNTKKVVKYLIEHGANINAKDFMNLTPLVLSCERNQLKTVKYLINIGADIINIKNNEGITLLECIYNQTIFIYIYNGCRDAAWKYVLKNKDLQKNIYKIVISEIVLMRNVLLPLELLFDTIENLLFREVYKEYDELISKYNNDKYFALKM